MKHLKQLSLLFGIPLPISCSCREDTNLDLLCGCESPTIEYYENVQGKIKTFETLYYIQLNIGDGTIGVEPCEGLADEFKNEDLEVIVNGELKQFCTLGESVV